MQRLFYILLLTSHFSLFSLSVSAQVSAQMKLWDQKFRFPKINEIEFQGDTPQLASYDAIYGHGAMWENEWMGFRVYLDYRQSIDLYGKKHPQMELDQTNFYTTDEQWEAGYGEDILFVGQSIGAGSFRGYASDSLLFVNPVKARGQRVLKEGPDTAIVEIYANDWQYQGQVLQFRQRFTAIRGQRGVKVDVYIDGNESVNDLHFATGVQKFEFNNSGIMRTDGLVASWGSNVPDKAGHPDRMHTLGMVVTVDEKYLVEVKEDTYNYLCILRPVNGHIRYWMACASDLQEKDGFHSASAWFNWCRKN